MTRNNNEDGKGGRATYEFLSPPPLSLVFADRVKQTCMPRVGIYLPSPSGLYHKLISSTYRRRERMFVVFDSISDGGIIPLVCERLYILKDVKIKFWFGGGEFNLEL